MINVKGRDKHFIHIKISYSKRNVLEPEAVIDLVTP